ncbi:MAG: SRPBCC domain-containing protein [bacterium]|nr:SRPBCC domain-containing protein [bacterium]MCP4305619.1 SRPBCC domain-containing protein [bacterium]
MDAIRRSITIQAPIDRVWAYLTESDKIAAWLMPNTFSPVAGRSFTMDCPPGIGSGAPVQCEVTELRPPTRSGARLAYTWTIDQPPTETLLTIDLTRTGDATRLDLEHSGWEQLGPEDSYVRDRHEQGWDMLLNQRLLPLVTGESRSS